jgi:SAM-dependent methyltransferase
MSTMVAGNVARGGRALNFDRLAGVYRWMEGLSFGPHLWRCRCAFLGEMTEAQEALLLGDGDGRFTAALLKRNRQVRVTAVDVSEAMLRSLRRKAGADEGRVRTEACDVREWSPAEAECDLIVTHFFLDCLTTEEVRRLAERLKSNLRPGARWVVSEFAVPEGWFGRWVARPVVGFLYRAFGVLTGLEIRRLPEWEAELRRAGFRQVGERLLLHGLLTSQIWMMAGSSKRVDTCRSASVWRVEKRGTAKPNAQCSSQLVYWGHAEDSTRCCCGPGVLRFPLFDPVSSSDR